MNTPTPTSSPTPIEHQSSAHFFARAKSDQISFYFRHMHALLHAGVGLSFALSAISEQKASPALKRASAEMCRQISQGCSWSRAMENHPGLFSEITVSIIRAAQAGGFLERACLLLADDAEREYQIYQAIKRETWYPKLLLFISTFIFPLPIPLPWNGSIVWLGAVWQMLLVLAGWIGWKAVNYFWPVGVHGGAVRLWLDGVRLKMPLAGKVVRGLAAAKFCRFLALSFAAGLSLPRGVALAVAACGNGALSQKLAVVIPLLERGSSLADALAAIGELPGSVIALIRSGETGGDLDAPLQTAARFLEMETETAMRETTIALGLVIFLLVAIKIGAQVIGFHAR